MPELTETLHPHDPRAADLDYSQAMDMLRYFGAGRRLSFHVSSPTWVTIFEGGEVLQHGGLSDAGGPYEDALQSAGIWPDRFTCPPPPRYVSVHSRESPGMAQVMRGGTCIAVASSHNAGKLIAHALNWYKPGRRGC